MIAVEQPQQIERTVDTHIVEDFVGGEESGARSWPWPSARRKKQDSARRFLEGAAGGGRPTMPGRIAF
jgi:hypothetical protein